MSKEPKTRFYARIRGQDRALFSVKESGIAGLTITSRTPKHFGNSYENQSEFDNQHYSVHASNDGRDTTITQKTYLIGPSHHSNVAFLSDTTDYLLWPVFARWLPILDSDASLLKIKAKDTVIKLADYDSETSTMLYSVFVSRPSFDLSTLLTANVHFKSVTIGNYMLIAIPAFMHVPSLIDGGVAGFSTSPTIVDNNKSEEHFHLSPKPIPAHKIVDYHNVLIHNLRMRYLQTLHNYFMKINESLDIELGHFEFHQQPLIAPSNAANL